MPPNAATSPRALRHPPIRHTRAGRVVARATKSAAPIPGMPIAPPLLLGRWTISSPDKATVIAPPKMTFETHRHAFIDDWTSGCALLRVFSDRYANAEAFWVHWRRASEVTMIIAAGVEAFFIASPRVFSARTGASEFGSPTLDLLRFIPGAKPGRLMPLFLENQFTHLFLDVTGAELSRVHDRFQRLEARRFSNIGSFFMTGPYLPAQ
jgi:hypothetical protein